MKYGELVQVGVSETITLNYPLFDGQKVYENAPISDEDKEKIAFKNAEKLFRLSGDELLQ